MSFTILIHILIPFLRSNFFLKFSKQFYWYNSHAIRFTHLRCTIQYFSKKKKKKNTSQGCAAIIAVQSLSHVWLCKPQGLQHTRLPCPSPSPGACPNSSPWNQWCHPTISSFVMPFSSRLQSFPTSGSLPVSQLFASGGQSIGASASASVLPMNIQGWFPLGLTGLISLQSEGLSRVFFSTTVQKHQFFSAQPSLWSNSHVHTWLLEKLQL